MGTMYITEYADIGSDEFSRGMQIPVEGEDTPDSQVKTTSGTHVQSDAFADSTRIVCIHLTTAGFVKFGANPTSTAATGAYIAAGNPRFFAVSAGMIVSAIE